jgi:hypothetical protein
MEGFLVRMLETSIGTKCTDEKVGSTYMTTNYAVMSIGKKCSAGWILVIMLETIIGTKCTDDKVGCSYMSRNYGCHVHWDKMFVAMGR